MPTLKLQWWLGNQMFWYALAYSLSKKYDEPIVLDPYFLENRFIWANWTFRYFELEVFGIQKDYAIPSTITSRWIHPEIIALSKRISLGNRYIKEQWGKLVESFPREAYLDGWFQSYSYFDAYSEDIKKLFTVQTPMSIQNDAMMKRINDAGKNSVSIHVRRGDYVTLDTANKWHGVCSVGYYETAIQSMIEKVWNPTFFIFSDDIAWCKENIIFPEGVVSHFVDYNGKAGHEDMRLMYSCSQHIIANSSFSWWWAYLGRNPEKMIIAPKKWLQTDSFSTQNLIPPSWILL